MTYLRAITNGLAVVLALAWAPASLAENHRQYADTKKDECSECHRGSGVMENHGATFLKDHRLLAQKTPNNCYDCHQQAWCSDCHHGGTLQHQQTSSLSRRGEAMPETHAADFVSTHAMKAADDPASCARCHDSRSFCNDCHQRWVVDKRSSVTIKPHAPVYTSPGVLDPAWTSFHRAEARRNLSSCQSCHPSKSSCSNFACHPGLGGR